MKRFINKETIHLYVIFFMLFLGMMVAAFFMILDNLEVQLPDGRKVLSKWPIESTAHFSRYLSVVEDVLTVQPEGVAFLNKNKLWLQILDSNGTELRSIDRPKNIPKHYSPKEFIDVIQYGSENGAVFTGAFSDQGRTWTYLIGYPFRISKVTTYMNGDRFNTMKPIFLGTFFVAVGLLLLISLMYGAKVERQNRRIKDAIHQIAQRRYVLPIKNDESEISEELLWMDKELQKKETEKERTEQAQREWIEDLTHDLKAPFGPIVGYSELIREKALSLGDEELKAYSQSVLKNGRYAERLVSELKMAYQLKNGIYPLKVEQIDLVRFLKEQLIEILNRPEYEDREILFSSEIAQWDCAVDPILIKRAFQNLILNGLVHNDPETQIRLNIVSLASGCQIQIEDNGKGIKEEDLGHLFDRYYRGTNGIEEARRNNRGVDADLGTEIGTGLGMGIAKGIIELHEGEITVTSRIGEGTRICISLRNRK